MNQTPKTTTNNASQPKTRKEVADQVVKNYDGKAAPELQARKKEKVLLEQGVSEADAQKDAASFERTLINREALEKASVDDWFRDRLAQDGEDFWENFEQFKIDAPKVHLKQRVILLRHEETAGFPATRQEVLDRVSVQKKGYKGRGNLGGDPVRDSSLIAAVTSKQQNGLDFFIDAYREKLTEKIEIWARRNGLAGECDKETWYLGFCGEAYSQNNWFELYRGDAGLIIFLGWRLLDYLPKNFGRKQGNDVVDDGGKQEDKGVDGRPGDRMDGEYWDSKIREAYDVMLKKMTPLQRRVLLLGASAKASDDETIERCAKKYKIDRFRDIYAQSRSRLLKAFSIYEKDLQEDLQKRLLSGECPELSAMFRRIDPETGDLLN